MKPDKIVLAALCAAALACAFSGCGNAANTSVNNSANTSVNNSAANDRGKSNMIVVPDSSANINGNTITNSNSTANSNAH